jgi:H+-transporting ATPase
VKSVFKFGYTMTDLNNVSLSAVEEAVPRNQSRVAFSTGLTSNEAANLLRIHGKNELEDKKTPKWLILLQQFWAPMPIMIWIAAIVEVAIENYPDFGILMAIQFINASLGFYEIVKVIRKLL